LKAEALKAVTENRVRAVQLAIEASRGSQFTPEQFEILYTGIYNFFMGRSDRTN